MRKPQIGDTRPAPAPPLKRGAPPRRSAAAAPRSPADAQAEAATPPAATRRRRRSAAAEAAQARRGVPSPHGGSSMTPRSLERRRGRERNGRPVGRYLMCVQVRPTLTQVAVLEGRNLIEHYVSRPADDVTQIHGNIYLGQVQNVLPGMEAAFVDIGTPKNAVLYRGDVQYDAEDIVEKGGRRRASSRCCRPSS